MRISAKDLKKWLKTIDDDSCISVSIYDNKHEKEFIIATLFDEHGKQEQKEIMVFSDEDEE